MGITSVRAWIVAASLLSICAVSHAAGLGKLNVLSALGEPLNAEVSLVAEKNEIASLAVRLASRDAFERAGLVYANLLTSVKVSIENRATGEPYVRLTSSEAVNEPFVDLLIELTWSSGRISREFTALLDPPSFIAEREKQKSAAAEVRAAPTAPQLKAEPIPPAVAEAPTAEAAKPESAETEEPQSAEAEEPAAPDATEPAAQPSVEAPAAPVETIGGPQPTLLGRGSALPASVKSTPSADAYGPVKSGDTLGKIASATKPTEVSLDQMLVLLVRNNPHAFSGKNMNRLRAGKILQFPTADQFATITEAEARREVKIQARDWRTYKDQLAASAGQSVAAMEPAQQAVSGKVGATVQDKAAPATEQPKEILKLSENETAAGAAGRDAKSAARLRALDEEVMARDKAIKESNDRVVKLEKQIKDLHALLEMKNKGMADLQQPAGTPPAPVTPQDADQKPSQAVVPAPKVTPATPTSDAPAPARTTEPAPLQPAHVPPKPASGKTPPVSAREPSLMDRVLDQPAYLGVAITAGVLTIIGALVVRGFKRRRESKSDAEESGPVGTFGENPGPAYSAASGIAVTLDARSKEENREENREEKERSEEVDPLAEAEIFLAYGRDAQAEELLKEALENTPSRHELHLKLLQIYANRKDANSFEEVARNLQQATGGEGEIWNQAVALGYQVDSENPRYAAGKSAAGTAAATSAMAENVDFNIESEDSMAITPTDIDLGDGGNPFDRTQVIAPAGEPARDSTDSFEPEALPAMDFDVGPSPSSVAAPASQTTPAASASGLDFDIDLNSLTASPAARDEPAAAGLDFDMSGLSQDTPGESRMESPLAAMEIDLSGISLDLGTDTGTSASNSPTGKDDHWYDVQTKFDLAKAYQEMGDKDGAREILKEVLIEGDAEQKTAAQSVLSSLDS